MVIETRTKPGFNPNNESVISPDTNLVTMVENIAEEKFRRRQVGRLIAKVIATTTYHRHNFEFRPERDKALRRLSEFNFSRRQLMRLVDELSTDFKADHEPFVKSLLKRS